MTLRSLILASAVLATSLGARAAEAQYYQPHPPGVQVYGAPGYHHWHEGDRYFGPRRFIHEWARYRLPPPPYGYGWVRDGNAFLLLRADGRIARIWAP